MRLLHPGELTVLQRFSRFFLPAFCLLWLSGCVAVKDAPVGKPYVVSNVVKLNAPDLNKEQKTVLEERLLTFVADSLAVPSRLVLGFTQILKPPVFDSSTLSSTRIFMNGFLNSEGYYGASFDTVIVKFDTVKRANKFFQLQKDKRVEVKSEFRLKLGKPIRIDTIWYAFSDSSTLRNDTLMQLKAEETKEKAALKKGDLYSKQNIANELDRLTAMYRQQGFFRMSRAGLLAEVDTTDPSLVNFDLDPIEQQIQAQKRRENPTAKIRILKRPGANPDFFKQYQIDSVFIYPETNISDNPDSLISMGKFTELSNGSRVQIRETEHNYQEKMLRRTNYLLPGQLYNETRYFRTVNSFTQMGPWQQLDVRTFTYDTDSVAKVNFHFFLFPAKRQSFQVDLEGSQNNNISASNVLAGRFFAVALGATYRSRNVWKKGTQSTLQGRAGLEINNNTSSGSGDIFQSFIFNVNQTFSLPRLLWPFRVLDNRQLDSRRTFIQAGLTLTDRFRFFKQSSFTAGLGWELRKGKNTFSFSFPTIEIVDTVSTDSLNKIIFDNPSLAYSFTPGNVLSTRASFERILAYNNTKHGGNVRISGELTVPVIDSMFKRAFFKFFKVEAQVLHRIQLPKSSLHFRFFGGVGWDLSDQRKANLPFFRQFVTGGSNSMRAWSIRQLGLGNSLASDTARFSDRFGDIQLEFNIEHRKRLMRLFGYSLEGAIFADIGNIWNHTQASDGFGAFSLKNLYRDLAVALGYGIRWDLSFLVVRFDAGFKVKDPVREGAGWLKTFEWKSTNRLGVNNRSNLAIQFGIGYPF